MVQVVGHLPGKYEVLSSHFSNTEEEQKEEEKEEDKEEEGRRRERNMSKRRNAANVCVWRSVFKKVNY
jgi:DNA/RNA-binding domain of Phe-tRNA-synthetase-like protein